MSDRIAEIEAAGVKPPFNMNFGWHSFMAGHVTAMGHCLAMAKDSEAVTRTLTSLRALEGGEG